MPVKPRERMGLIVLIGVLCILGVLLYFTMERPSGPSRGFSDSAIVQQRIINLKKSR